MCSMSVWDVVSFDWRRYTCSIKSHERFRSNSPVATPLLEQPLSCPKTIRAKHNRDPQLIGRMYEDGDVTIDTSVSTSFNYATGVFQCTGRLA